MRTKGRTGITELIIDFAILRTYQKAQFVLTENTVSLSNVYNIKQLI